MPRRSTRRVDLSRGLWPAALLAIIALLGAGPAAGAAGPVPAPPSFRSVPSETMAAGLTAVEDAARQADLHAWLVSEMPAGALDRPILISLTDDERQELHRLQGAKGGPAVVGRTKPVSETVRFSGLDAALLAGVPRRVGPGVLQSTPDGGFVFAVAVGSPGAGAVRVHIDRLNLPPEADLFFFSMNGQAFGPYSGKGPLGQGEFWTNTVFGSEGVIQLRHYGPNGAADLKRISFAIPDVGHIGREFTRALGMATESFCSFNVNCIENASCHNGTPAQAAKSAVALMQWIAGAFIYTCSGGLLADTVSATQIPYFLTANHCISRNRDAQNLEAYFQFSISCGSTSCPAQTQPGGIQRLGSTIKATGSSGDFTLLELAQAPPSGSVFLGWNNVPVAFTNGAPLHRISHPAWAPQAYSSQHVDASAPTCSSWPRGQRIYSRDDIGGTEGGSSGSPVVNAAGQVVGQLSGACGTNVNDSCDSVSNATVDGALAHYWPSVQPFLDPGPSCTPSAEICTDAVDNDCDGLTDCADSDCATDPACTGGCVNPPSCTSHSQCCPGSKCSGPKNNKTCR